MTDYNWDNTTCRYGWNVRWTVMANLQSKKPIGSRLLYLSSIKFILAWFLLINLNTCFWLQNHSPTPPLPPPPPPPTHTHTHSPPSWNKRGHSTSYSTHGTRARETENCQRVLSFSAAFTKFAKSFSVAFTDFDEQRFWYFP